MDKRSKIKVKTNWAFITTFVGMLFCCALQANFNNPTNNLLLKKIEFPTADFEDQAFTQSITTNFLHPDEKDADWLT